MKNQEKQRKKHENHRKSSGFLFILDHVPSVSRPRRPFPAPGRVSAAWARSRCRWAAVSLSWAARRQAAPPRPAAATRGPLASPSPRRPRPPRPPPRSHEVACYMAIGYSGYRFSKSSTRSLRVIEGLSRVLIQLILYIELDPIKVISSHSAPRR